MEQTALFILTQQFFLNFLFVTFERLCTKTCKLRVYFMKTPQSRIICSNTVQKITKMSQQSLVDVFSTDKTQLKNVFKHLFNY